MIHGRDARATLIAKEKRKVEPGVRVVLYTKAGCSLCEEMKAEMSKADCAGLYTLEEVDIESEAELFARYKYEIPVLFINGVEAFRHRLRTDEFKAYVTALVNEGS
jgi:glutaredoxin